MNRLSRLSRAFTLIELLVVITIISVLITIVVAVGSRVIGGGRERLTEGVIRVLDGMVEDYSAETGNPAPAYYVDKPGRRIYPIVDGRWADRAVSPADQEFDRDYDRPQPTGALLLAAMAKSPAVQETLGKMDAKLVRRQEVQGWGWDTNDAGFITTARIVPLSFEAPQILDGFGQPLRFVAPAFDGGAGEYWDGTTMADRDPLDVGPAKAMIDPSNRDLDFTQEFSRSYRPFNPTPGQTTATNPAGDADEGVCPTKTGYFYSAGTDGDPGRRDDNVYSTRPTFASETAKLK